MSRGVFGGFLHELERAQNSPGIFKSVRKTQLPAARRDKIAGRIDTVFAGNVDHARMQIPSRTIDGGIAVVRVRYRKKADSECVSISANVK